MHYIDAIVRGILGLPTGALYLFLCISAFTENICPPIPGDTIIAFGAFLVGQGRLNFFMAYLCTTVGSLAGFMFVFWVGLYLGERLFVYRENPFFKKQDIKKAEEWLRKYGYIIILVNRYIPGVRAVVSITSGILRLSPMKVMIMALMGCATWNMIIMYIGLNIGSNWEQIRLKLGHLLSQYNIAALVVLTCVVLIFFVSRWIKRKG